MVAFAYPFPKFKKPNTGKTIMRFWIGKYEFQVIKWKRKVI